MKASEQERMAKRALVAGGALVPFGLALVGTGPSEAGAFVSLGALLTLIYGIHAYGRLGPDEGDGVGS